ncbi:MAG TPA: TRL domain-containing protein [Nitrospiria bacterium]
MKRGNRWGVLFAGLMVLFLTSGCLYMNAKTPLDTDVEQTKIGPKVGEAHSYSVLWLASWGDAGTAAAARNGEITTIDHMDRHVIVILFGLYTRVTTIVYGD